MDQAFEDLRRGTFLKDKIFVLEKIIGNGSFRNQIEKNRSVIFRYSCLERILPVIIQQAASTGKMYGISVKALNRRNTAARVYQTANMLFLSIATYSLLLTV